MSASNARGQSAGEELGGASTTARATTEGVVSVVRSSQGLPPGEPLGEGGFLLERGLALDSVALLELTLALEERFQVRIEDHELTRQNFETVRTVAKLIERKLGSTAGLDA